LLRISTGLDVNDVAGIGSVDGLLNSSEAWRQSTAGRVCAIYVERSGLLCVERRREEPPKKQQSCDASKSLHRCPPPQKDYSIEIDYMKIRTRDLARTISDVKKIFVLARFDRID
jgi:hypothetical protein